MELACGTGIVTRQLRDRLPSPVKIVATDLNEAMIEVARRKCQRGVDDSRRLKPSVCG
ncbi:MAG: class I SAM-dependent methyltransferase [Candidatus Eremiobacteraeota bacterium]|nr:class I SAM-dependent methyltransferase [Candidatus Eremiobacteraeota bacterium]